MRKIALKVAYIGTDFYGFQRQPNYCTVEGELISALKESNIINNLKDSGYSIAGRTDRGVHALGNVISFRTETDIKLNYLNSFLPESIRFLAIAGVPFGFKPRYAKSRHYRYILAECGDLDFDKIKYVSQMLQGTHNFSNFSKRSERNPIRTIKNINLSLDKDNLVIDIIGESFLWNMVRKIAAFLFMMGNNELNLDDIQVYLDPKSDVSIKPLPPEGLILMDTIYEDIKFKYDEYARKKFLSTLKKEYHYNRTVVAVESTMINSLMD